MDARGLTQGALARAVDMSEGAVSRWFTETIPEPPVLAKLRKVLDVPLDRVFGVEDQMSEKAQSRSPQTNTLPTYNPGREDPPGNEVLVVPLMGGGQVEIPIDDVPAPRRAKLRSMISERMNKLLPNEVMFLRLDGGNKIDFSPHDFLSVKEVRGGGGGPYILVVQVIGQQAAGPTPQRGPIGRTSGRPRNIRRKPDMEEQVNSDEDRAEKRDDVG